MPLTPRRERESGDDGGGDEVRSRDDAGSLVLLPPAASHSSSYVQSLRSECLEEDGNIAEQRGDVQNFLLRNACGANLLEGQAENGETG